MTEETIPNPYAKVPAIVFAGLVPGELRLLLGPGIGMGGVLRDVKLDLVPLELRLPNTKVWVSLDSAATAITRVWRRSDSG